MRLSADAGLLIAADPSTEDAFAQISLGFSADVDKAVAAAIRDAERDIDTATRRIAEIGEDIARRLPTARDAFAMVVTGETHHERKMAGRALMKEILTLIQLQKRGETVLATIGGFDLVFEGQAFGRGEGYRSTTMLRRTGEFHEIDLPLTITPLGAIARLEHTLSGFEDERDRYRQRLEEVRRRLASYQSRQDGEFAFSGELAEKHRQLAEVEHALASDMADEEMLAA